MHTGIRNSQSVDQITRRLTKIKPNEIFNDFAKSWEPIDEIDSDDSMNLIFLGFKNVDIQSKLSNFEATKIAEVRAE